MAHTETHTPNIPCRSDYLNVCGCSVPMSPPWPQQNVFVSWLLSPCSFQEVQRTSWLRYIRPYSPLKTGQKIPPLPQARTNFMCPHLSKVSLVADFFFIHLLGLGLMTQEVNSTRQRHQKIVHIILDCQFNVYGLNIVRPS